MDEWLSLRKQPCNVLLEGPEEATDTVLGLLMPHLREPIVWMRRGAPLEFPATKRGTLILQDVAALDGHEQQRLLAWLNAEPPTQVVSATETPLFRWSPTGISTPHSTTG